MERAVRTWLAVRFAFARGKVTTRDLSGLIERSARFSSSI